MPKLSASHLLCLKKTQYLANDRTLNSFLEEQRRKGMRYLLSRRVPRDDAEEILQNTWVKFFIHSFKGKSLEDPAAYWFAVLRNTYKREYAGRRLDSSLDDHAFYLADDSLPLDEQAEIARKSHLVRAALRKLKQSKGTAASEAEILTLHYLEGLSLKGIARQLGLDLVTVKSRAHEGRKKLKRLLHRSFEEDASHSYNKE